MAQLGKAYIEVRADLSKFPAELRAELTKALKEGTAGVTFEELDKKAGAAGKKAADTIGNELERNSKTRLRKSGEKAGEDIGLGLFGTLRKIFTSNSSGTGFLGTIGDVFKSFTKSASDGFSQLSDIGSKISDIGGKIGTAFSAIGQGIQTGLYVLAVPAVGALLAVALQLSAVIFALPAGIALVVGAFAVFTIAMHGVTNAIALGMSGKAGDVKKFDAALKGLAPTARAVVKEIVGLKPAFEAIKNATQQSFFGPLVGVFKLLSTTLLPALKGDLSIAAAALGRFVAGFLKLLSEPEIVRDIGLAFAGLARVVDVLAPVLTDLFGSFFGLVKTGLPFVIQFVNYIAKAGGAFRDLLAHAEGTGRVAGWIAAVAEPFKTLIKLLFVVGDLFGTIFANPDVRKAGNDFLTYLVQAIGLLDKFFKSAQGQAVLKDFASSIERAGKFLLIIAGIIIGLLAGLHYLNEGIQLVVRSLGAFFAFIGGVALTVGKALVDNLVAQGKAWRNFFTKDIPAAYNAVVGFFVGIGKAVGDFFTKTIPGWFDAVVGFFKALPGKAGDGLTSLRSTIVHFFEDALKGAFDSVFRNIGIVIGLFLAIPTEIRRALANLAVIVHDAFFDALHFVLNGIQADVDAIVKFFTVQLPNGISAGLSFLKNVIVTDFQDILHFFETVPPAIGRFFVSVYHAIVDNVKAAAIDAKNFVVDGFNSVVSFLGSLPGKVAALGPKLLNAARGLGHAIGDGLREIGNFAKNIGNDILNGLKSGINHIINSINSGINSVGGALHIKLPNLPGLAHGGIIDSPTIALLGEGSKREVVVPLTDPARARELAAQSGLTKILAKGSAAPIVNVTAILGTGELLTILDTRVETALDTQGTEFSYGTR